MSASQGGAVRETATSPRPAKLVRRADRRLVAGVAGGIADRLGLHPLWVRVGFVVLLLGAGAGLLLYLSLWWLVPRADLPESGAEEFLRRFPEAPAWMGRVLVIAGIGVLASQIAPKPGEPHWSPPFVVGFVLVAIGIALFRRDVVRERQRALPEIAGIPDPGADVPSPPSPPGEPEAPAPPVATAFAPAERPARERSRLGVLTIGSAMIVVSVAVLLDGLGAITLEVGRFPAIALVVLGAGLLVGAWWGRARGAIVLGLLILPVALVLSLVHFPFGGEVASRTLYPRRIDPFPASQRLLAGEITVNLMRVDLAGSVRTLEVEMGVGIVHLVVPRDVTIHLEAEVGIGELRVIGHPDRRGVDVSKNLTLPGRRGGGTLILRVEQGIGSVDLSRLRPRETRAR